jgi:threonylcarbamoyladenosine tRNA methylthiotransferase MtaB
VASFYVENFGCRATQADGAAIERQFQERGLERAETPSEARIVVLNTCTVTAAADQDARAAIRRIQRQNPGCQIVVTGCYAQRAPEEVAALPGVSCVVGNSHKHFLGEIALRVSGAEAPAAKAAPSFGPGTARLKPCPSTVLPDSAPLPDNATLVESAEGFVPISQLTSGQRRTNDDDFLTTEVFVSDIFAHTELLAAPVFDAANERTRPNLKVQDGCDNRCSFCVIPYVRGQSRSLPLARVLDEVSTLVVAGYREVVISGINLGRWGKDLAVSYQPSALSNPAQPPATSRQLPDLIRSILAHTALEKLRISSVEPMDWSDELIALAAGSPRIAKHAHVPMQSGSDRVLRAMHRKYRPWHYREKIEKIRAAMPTAAIGADVMVGFPGETDADFESTRRMIEDLPFTYLHVFTYSPRPGTPAAALPAQVPVEVARQRNRVLRELAAEKKLAFMRSFVGGTVEVITLNRSQVTGRRSQADNDPPATFTESLTDNYLKLRLRGQHEANRWMTARVESVESGAMVGMVG